MFQFIYLFFCSASGYKGGSASKPTSRSQSPPSPASMISINTVLESIRTKIERGEPLRMEAFFQLEASAINSNNFALKTLVQDMVSTLKKSAATLGSSSAATAVAAPNAEKVDPSMVVYNCKFLKTNFNKQLVGFLFF